MTGFVEPRPPNLPNWVMILILLMGAAPWIGRDWGRESGKAPRNRTPIVLRLAAFG